MRGLLLFLCVVGFLLCLVAMVRINECDRKELERDLQREFEDDDPTKPR